ncbi:hypothetical protein Btru_075205 [Bulinus truncatus]|nr:hypothetical protein Btru_075205 [Bulinus truncatus]
MVPLSVALLVLVLLSAASKLHPSLMWATVTASSHDGIVYDEDLAREIDQFVLHILPCHQSPALTLAIVKEGTVVLTKGYGFTSTNMSVNTTSKTRFAIGSLTKAFTATLVAKWVLDQDSITIDTPIQSYLPGISVADDLRSARASLRDLLSHRMGIPSYFQPLTMGYPAEMTRQMLVDRLAYMPTTREFRDKLTYNNYMYMLAAHVVERMSGGKTWEQLLRDTLLRPLHMRDTGFLEELHSYSNFALPCALVNGTMVDLSTELFKTVFPCEPAGSIYSNAEDMAKWMNFLLSNGLGPDGSRVVKSEVIKLTREPGMLSTLPFQELTKPLYPVSHVVKSYDMGWLTAYYRGHRQVFHTGGIVTHSSRLWLYPDAKVGIYVSVNGPQEAQDKNSLLESLMYYTSDLLLHENPWLNRSVGCPVLSTFRQRSSKAVNTESSQWPNSVDALFNETKSDLPLEVFLGVYRHRCFGSIEISFGESNQSLVFKFGRFGWINLTRVDETDFTGRFFGPLSYLTITASEKVRFLQSPLGDIDSILVSMDSEVEHIKFDRCDHCVHNSMQQDDVGNVAHFTAGQQTNETSTILSSPFDVSLFGH